MRKMFLVGLIVATLSGCGSRFVAYGKIAKSDNGTYVLYADNGRVVSMNFEPWCAPPLLNQHVLIAYYGDYDGGYCASYEVSLPARTEIK